MPESPSSIPPNPARRLFRFFLWFRDYDPNSTSVQDVLLEYFRHVEKDVSATPIDSLCRAVRLPAAAEAAVRAAAGNERTKNLCQWKTSSDNFFAGFSLETTAHNVGSRLNSHHMDLLDACAILVDVAARDAQDDATDVLVRIVEFRQEIVDMKIDETLRAFILGALDELERAVVDHCSGVPDQDRIVMSTAYDTWRKKQETKKNTTAAKGLEKLGEITVAVFNCVVRANAALGLVEKMQRLLGE